MTTVRLSHISQFRLILVWPALRPGQVASAGVALVQVVCPATMILSTYRVAFTLPSPLAVTDRLKQN
jgi:hypothetical protein